MVAVLVLTDVNGFVSASSRDTKGETPGMRFVVLSVWLSVS